MILKITNACRMACPHCMEDAKPDGLHMSGHTFAQSLDFICRLEPVAVIVSGGEPTDHPLCFEYLMELVKVVDIRQVILLSNGMFFTEKPELARRLLNAGFSIDVVNDPKYYPSPVAPVSHPNVRFFSHIAGYMLPLGRAKDNGFDDERSNPSCFNFRSILRGSPFTFPMAVKALELGMVTKTPRLCFPCILPDGDVTIGESIFCYRVGHVQDSLSTLEVNTRNMRCNQCGLVGRLSPTHRAAIGEM